MGRRRITYCVVRISGGRAAEVSPGVPARFPTARGPAGGGARNTHYEIRNTEGFMRIRLFVGVLLVALAAAAAAEEAKPNTLTPKEIEDGWILLFDGETSFGWKTDGDVKVADGMMTVGGDKESSIIPTTEFGDYELHMDLQTDGPKPVQVLAKVGETARAFDLTNTGLGDGKWATAVLKVDNKTISASMTMPGRQAVERQPTVLEQPIRLRVGFVVPAGSKLNLRNVKARPLNLKSIFNGKDLTGWKVIPGHNSVYTVTDKGEMNVKNGNGDIQTDEQWADFVLQLDIFSNGPHLNSGVFFRCLPGEFWSGYESQIRNQWQGDDRSKPVDYGTGGIYNRQPARKVVSSDKEWFTKTIVAHGNHMAVWVNGYQVSDFTDTRPANRSGRNGCKLDKGPISLQGHDPTTDLSFRNIRIYEMPPVQQ